MRYFSIFWSTAQTYWKKGLIIWFSLAIGAKPLTKKQFTNLSAREKCLLFLCPLMYSLIEEETIQRRKNPVAYRFVMIHKSVMISIMAVSDEKLNGRKPSLSAWSIGHFNKHLRCFKDRKSVV